MTLSLCQNPAGQPLLPYFEPFSSPHLSCKYLYSKLIPSGSQNKQQTEMMKSSSNFFIISVFIVNFIFSLSVLGSAHSPLSSSSPWETFLNLTDCHNGEANPILPELKKYLHYFGYLAASPNFTESFDDQLESALRTYQQNFGLDVTGVLDLSTIMQLISPRCGVPDIINGTSSMSSGKLSGRHLYAYFPGEPTWPSFKRQLTYAVTSTSAVNIDPSVLRSVFARAFGRWSAATNLNFTEVTSESDADITIGFYSGDHGDGEAFDGVLGTLAHAFSPTDGRFHLDAAEQWVAEGDVAEAGSVNAVDLESVAVHEIGHLLGLGHSSVGEAIMYPTIRTRTRKVELAKDDVEGVQKLYGSNPNYAGGGSTAAGNQRDTNGGGRRGSGLRLGGVVGSVLLGIVMGL